MSIPVGPIRTRNRVFLAPMSGVTDEPFRAVAHAYGAGLVVSEMVASEELVEPGPICVRRRRGEPIGSKPFVIQLAGREARWMAEGARLAQDLGADIIDINMGCPARQVTGGLSGSALMRDLDHAAALIEATVQAARVPVTLKMRLGWDADSINAPELARRAEEAGVQMITVHGRTRCQFYGGRADWSAIRAVKEADQHSPHRQWRLRRLPSDARPCSRDLRSRWRHDWPRRLWPALVAGRRSPTDWIQASAWKSPRLHSRANLIR